MKTYKEYCEELFKLIPHVNFVTFDDDLYLYATTEKPVKCEDDKKWRVDRGCAKKICSISELDLTGVPSWDESIVSRPVSFKRIPIVRKYGYWHAGDYIVNIAEAMCGFMYYQGVAYDTYDTFADILEKCNDRPLDLTGWTVVVA